MNAEYLSAAVKPGTVCSICKDHLFNSVAECKSICKLLVKNGHEHHGCFPSLS